MAMALATMVYIAASEARAGTLTAGDFIAFFTAMILLLSPVKRLTDINNPLQRGMTSGVAELLDFSSVDWSPHSGGRRW